MCPSSATTVYSGRVGGNFYSTSGGGAQYLCLSSSPSYLATTAGVQTPSSALYRTGMQCTQRSILSNLSHCICLTPVTEYETATAALSTTWTAAQNWEVPCVVCQSSPRRGYR